LELSEENKLYITLSVKQNRNDFVAKYISAGLTYQRFLLSLDGKNQHKACLTDKHLCLLYHNGDRSLRNYIVSHKGAGDGILDLVATSKNTNEIRYFIAGRPTYRKTLLSKLMENPSKEIMPYLGLSLNLKKIKINSIFEYNDDNYEFKRLLFIGIAQNVTATIAVLYALVNISIENRDKELMDNILNNQNINLNILAYIMQNNDNSKMNLTLVICKTLLRLKGCLSV